ncbi:hypothetical protein Bca52824_026789 [Brassica carinata]|uniref:Uncharacterized protein n=1 Tax=Brassica carinata TaxID=52824 RepID=A0A8X7VAC8_BRACI|nr:hypothetical protein Bca52824_026789 [Brassica carinata]
MAIDPPSRALGLSSVGGRVRSRRGNETSDLGKSASSSLISTAEVESPKFDETATVERISSDEEEGSSPVDPTSKIGAWEIGEWRRRYDLPQEVVIRAPNPSDRISDFRVDEVPVYEAFFESGFRGGIPSLIAKLSEFLEISPGQLTPPAWRILIAIQNLGDLENLILGVDEVLFSYFVVPLHSGGGRYYLHPRNSNAPVREISKNERKHHPIFVSWAERFAFMTIPGFSPVWHIAGRLL